MLGDDNFFTKYFENYFDVGLNHEDALSSENNIVKALESITDYVLMGASLHNKKSKLPQTQTSEETPQPDNYYKSNDQKIFERDFKDEELAPLVDYQKLKNTIKDLKNSGNKCRISCDRLIGEINKDMIVVKNCIKKPVILSGCFRGMEPVHWTEVDYYDYDHIRQLIMVGPRPLNSSLGIIVADVERMISAAGLTDSEKEILNFIRFSGGTQADAALEFGCSRVYVNKTISNITNKIIEYNLNSMRYVD